MLWPSHSSCANPWRSSTLMLQRPIRRQARSGPHAHLNQAWQVKDAQLSAVVVQQALIA